MSIREAIKNITDLGFEYTIVVEDGIPIPPPHWEIVNPLFYSKRIKLETKRIKPIYSYHPDWGKEILTGYKETIVVDFEIG